jgi:transposase
MKRRLNKTTFNPYPQNQLMLSTILDGFIPEVNLVRVVDEVIEEMDIVPLLKQYKGGGSSSYHSRLMLKILVNGHTQKDYSSRRIAKFIRENINNIEKLAAN